ncbi:hypothetical protein [Streptacidiphilus carbonis]|uniref:hypothetical protein n=1 Tax=Streptacidiphilus carbonis TaxID=105422 RepID=UPI0005AA601F|nr:hypothetical protein [Streptacidiphilus carbonis]
MALPSDGVHERRSPFADSDLITGSPRIWPYVMILVVTAGADVAAFYQVVALIMPVSPWLVYLLVVGLTGTALSLAHFAGIAMRTAEERARPTHSARHAGVLIAIWMLLGAAAFIIRLLGSGADAGSGSSTGFRTGGSASDSTGTPHQALLTAGLFLALYLGTGAIACLSSHRAHNPVALAHRRARQAQQVAAQAARHTGSALVRAELEHQQQLDERERDERRWQHARAERLAWAEELKRYARVLMATHLADPAATDGLTDPDLRPSQPSGREVIHLVRPDDGTAEPGSEDAAG